jgi:hypothetical protein
MKELIENGLTKRQAESMLWDAFPQRIENEN